jgi:dihydroorotase
VIERAKAAKVKIYPCAAITKGLNGKELCDFKALKAAGAVAVSDDGKPVENVRLMAEAMVQAHEAGLKVIAHCEDLRIAGNGIVHKGIVSEQLGVEGISRASENFATMRELCLANELQVPIHIAHVSTREAISYIKMAKNNGINVTCEVSPHHFSFTDKELLSRDADFRMNPPLRDSGDVLKIAEVLCVSNERVIDCIASDHAPHTAEEKADFETALNGVIGLETLLAATLMQFYHTANVTGRFSKNISRGKLSLSKIVELLCVNPRKILGIPGGDLLAGSPADIAVINMHEDWTVEPEQLYSKSKNTCFKGVNMKGRVKYTLLNGEVVYDGVGQIN